MRQEKREKKAKTTKLAKRTTKVQAVTVLIINEPGKPAQYAVKTNFKPGTSYWAQYIHIAECEKIVCNLKLELLQKEVLHTKQKTDKQKVA